VHGFLRKALLTTGEPFAVTAARLAHTAGQMPGEFGWKIRVHNLAQRLMQTGSRANRQNFQLFGGLYSIVF
jgi:hypothetical protein